ncbi:chaplin [Streptomyces sp. NPDC001380]|uniref:chaplin n=1 Tax=Streptomyces sp. NPDC001380 TaxID=3364566 RepID=UPI00367AC120
MRNIKKATLVSAASLGMIVAGAASASALGAGAQGAAVGSPGVASGNVVQLPIHIPVNVCGNSINVVGILNPAFGNTCINASGGFGHERGHEYGGERGHGYGGERGHEHGGWDKGHGEHKGEHGKGHGKDC